MIPQYRSGGVTHPGLLRPSNQDSFLERSDLGLWAVADGMGGYRDGDVASRMVCDALATLDVNASLEASIAAARSAVAETNAQLYRASTRVLNPVISGTTVVILIAKHASCAVLWAGDSRLYRLRQGLLQQMTTDHTIAAELNLPTTQVDDHAITRAVGGESVLYLDELRDSVESGDRYLLCSDGLNRELAEDDIARQLSRGDAGQSASALIAATLQAGARDNVTAIVIDTM